MFKVTWYRTKKWRPKIVVQIDRQWLLQNYALEITFLEQRLVLERLVKWKVSSEWVIVEFEELFDWLFGMRDEFQVRVRIFVSASCMRKKVQRNWFIKAKVFDFEFMEHVFINCSWYLHCLKCGVLVKIVAMHSLTTVQGWFFIMIMLISV